MLKSDQNKLRDNLKIMPEEKLNAVFGQFAIHQYLSKVDIQMLRDYRSYVKSVGARFQNEAVENKRLRVRKMFNRLCNKIDKEFLLRGLEKDGAEQRYYFRTDLKEGSKRKRAKLEMFTKIFSKCKASYHHFVEKASKVGAEAENVEQQITKDIKSYFDDKHSRIVIGTQKIDLPPYKQEYLFCLEAYKKEVGEPISWDMIFNSMDKINEIELEELKIDFKKAKRKIFDIIVRINKRINEKRKNKITLFEMKGKVVLRKI